MRHIRPGIATLMGLMILLLHGAGSVLAEEIGGHTGDRPSGSASRAMVGGALAGTAGFGAGFIVGAAMFSSGDDEYAGLGAGLVLGSVLGGLALPLGVHAGNRDRGNGWLVVGTSLAVGGAGWALAFTSGEAFVLPMTAVTQLLVCTAVELGTSPDPEPVAARSPRPRITIGPGAIDGKPGLVIAGTF